MKNMIYSKSTEELDKAGIEYYNLEKIVDNDRIKLLSNVIYQNEILPDNIEIKKSGEEMLTNQSLYEGLKDLPIFIIRKQQVITDEEEILKISTYKKEHHLNNPPGILSRYTNTSGINELKEYYYSDKYAYYKIVYDFYEKKYLTDEEISFKLSAISTRTLLQINSTLSFFKYYLIITIILSVILFLMVLANN